MKMYVVVALGLLVVACGRGAVSGEVLAGEALFSLDIGVLENEMDFFYRGDTLPLGKNSIFMYRGIIFIGNSLGHKVMEFSSYGDLISLIYNDDENPRPLLLSVRSSEENIVNKPSHPFPFRKIGDIAVSSEHVLLVEDRVAPERVDFDKETSTVLQHIIHRFNADGSYMDYIGQEGVGGTPFPFIVSMGLTARDDLVVITRNNYFHNVFWYNKEGERLFSVVLDDAHLPAGKNPEDYPSLKGIFPDMDKYQLYLHINYEDAEEGRMNPWVYVLDLDDGRYTRGFELSNNRQAIPGEDGIDYIEYPHQFIGVAEGENLFFISLNSAFEYSLFIFDSAGNLKIRRVLQIENPDVFFSDYQVSREGIITALLGDPDSVDVYWWRIDLLLEPARIANRGNGRNGQNGWRNRQ